MSVATTSAPAAAAGSAAFPVPVLGAGEREVCVHDPGFCDDAVVTTDVATLVAWHCGRLSLGQAQRAGMRVAATPADERMLDAWGRLSPFAGVSPVGRS
jgi:hypothetical protein